MNAVRYIWHINNYIVAQHVRLRSRLKSISIFFFCFINNLKPVYTIICLTIFLNSKQIVQRLVDSLKNLWWTLYFGMNILKQVVII